MKTERVRKGVFFKLFNNYGTLDETDYFLQVSGKLTINGY